MTCRLWGCTCSDLMGGKSVTWIPKGMYPCNGHYHDEVTHLMVNPYTKQTMPDQWCQGNRTIASPFVQPKSTVNQVKETFIMSQSLWCDAGGETVIDSKGTTIQGHAFSSLDLDMEEQTRTRRVRDKYGEIRNVTVNGHACGMHIQKFPSEITDGKNTLTDTAE